MITQIRAHLRALRDANEHFGEIAQRAMEYYSGDREAQYAYLAGYIQQLRRNGENYDNR
jgi:hypothetical protein